MSTSTSISTTSTIINFYDPNIQAPDHSGRTLASILALPDTSLEYCHDYIQLLFPLPEPSAIQPSTSTIDKPTFIAFRSRPELRDQLTKSLTRMLRFYGFEPSWSPQQQGGSPPDHITAIVRSANFDRASRNWVRRFDHNHLRITRIIRSLRVLGLEGPAQHFFRALVSVYDNGRAGISARSLMFWTRAAERPLYLAPEDERDEGQGKDFLYEYEARREVGANGDVAVKDRGDGNGQGANGAGEEDDIV